MHLFLVSRGGSAAMGSCLALGGNANCKLSLAPFKLRMRQVQQRAPLRSIAAWSCQAPALVSRLVFPMPSAGESTWPSMLLNVQALNQKVHLQAVDMARSAWCVAGQRSACPDVWCSPGAHSCSCLN